MTKRQAAIMGAIVVTAAAVPMAIHRHTQMQSFTQANAVLRGQLAGLKADNAPLAAAPAPASSETSGELLRLRSEVTRLRSAAQSPTPGSNAADSAQTNLLDEEFRALQARIALLEQKLEESPEDEIPEEELLTRHDRLYVALSADLHNHGGIRYNLNQLRTAAKDQFAPLMAAALRTYVDVNNGQLPSSISQLRPFLPSTITDAMLDRYELLPTGNAGELPSDTPIVAGKATNDRMVDSLFSIGLDRYRVKIITQVINGRGMRTGGSDAEMVKYIPGIQLR